MRPHRYRGRVGGMWELMGELQLHFLLSVGLKPEHMLLDVGCGCFRGGARFLQYLDDGNYVGLDKNQALVDAGRAIELPAAGINGKAVTTIVNGDFNLSGYAAAFDYAIAQSVFPHLTRDEIGACMASVCRALKPSGRFYATYFPPPECSPPRGIVTHESANPFHQEIGFYEGLAAELPLAMVDIGDWGHPRSQKMLGFTKTGMEVT